MSQGNTMVVLTHKQMRTAMYLSALLFFLSVTVITLAEMSPFDLSTSLLALLFLLAALPLLAVTCRKLVSVDRSGLPAITQGEES